MKITIKCEPKEIADLATEIRDRLFDESRESNISLTIGKEKIADIVTLLETSRSTH